MNKGIYLLPSTVTICSIFCGFYSILTAIKGDFVKAALVLILAGIFDVLDGKIARWTKSVSQFGIELDSLADMIAFGFAPAILIYYSVLQPYGKIGWMAAFLYVACGAMRLARHNVIAKASEDKGFVGMPIPGAAGVIVAYIIFSNSEYAYYVPQVFLHPLVVAIVVYLLAILMVSNLPYHGLKEINLKRRKPFSFLILFIFFLFTIVTYYKFLLMIIGILYLLSGPTEFIFRQIIKKRIHIEQKNHI